MKELLNKKSFPFLACYFVLGLIIYFSSLRYNYLLDDVSQILRNPFVHDLSQFWVHFTNSTMASAQGVTGIYYKPFMMLIYSLLWNIGGGSSFAFHLFQLFLHCFNAYLVFTLFKKFLEPKRIILAFLIGLIFLCHPINSEAVLFIADLQEPLYTFFGLVGLLITIEAENKKQFIFAALFFLSALLSKESGLLYLLISTIYCFLFKKNHFKFVISCMIAIISVYLFLRLGLANLSSLHADNMQISRSDLATRLINMPKVLIHYIHLFFYPQNIALTQDWLIREISWQNFTLPLLEVLTLLGASIYYIFKKKSLIFIFFFLWFGFGWGLHSQLIPLDGTVSDRWFYFTMLGFLGMIFIFLENEIKPSNLKISIFLSVIILALSVRSYYRTLNWQNGLTLYQHDVKIDPNSFYLNNNLGLELQAQGKLREAIPYFEKSLSLSPSKSRSWYISVRNLGVVFIELGDFEKAQFLIQLCLADQDVKSYRAYAWVLESQGKIEELMEFLNNKALKEYPNDVPLLKVQKAHSN